MTALAPQHLPGWFGKLSMLGDFAQRRLPVAVVQSCDEWLSASVAQSRALLGRDWLQIYLGAPLWCFALAPRVIDTSYWPGVLMPSVDAVGRYFPLLVMRATPGVSMRSDALESLSGWYHALADCALSTLEPRATLEAFETRLAAIDWPVIDLPQPAAQTMPTEGHSLWWPLTSAPQAPNVSIVRGLPAPARFAQLLQGHL